MTTKKRKSSKQSKVANEPSTVTQAILANPQIRAAEKTLMDVEERVDHAIRKHPEEATLIAAAIGVAAGAFVTYELMGHKAH